LPTHLVPHSQFHLGIAVAILDAMPASHSDSSAIHAAISRLVTIPTETFASILSHVSNREIKNLRLKSKALSERAAPRLDRAFLSVNRRNVEVFLALADHDGFREQVTEFVWDDARLRDFIPHPDDAHTWPAIWPTGRPLWESLPPEACPKWFEMESKEHLEETMDRIYLDEDRPDIVHIRRQAEAQLPFSDSWLYYEELLGQQDEVLETGVPTYVR
jgi:hypothetical protein